MKATYREFNFASAPPKSGRYTTIYRRAKSRDLVEGTATYYVRSTKHANKGWANITGPRGTVYPSFDSRDNRKYFPTVVAWR